MKNLSITLELEPIRKLYHNKMKLKDRNNR